MRYSLETHACTRRIILQLHCVIQLIPTRSTTRFGELQGGVEILEDEYFGSLPLCLIFFNCSDQVQNPSY